MSIYDYGDFTKEQVVDFSIEYPLAEFGDTTTKLYKMIGRVKAANYTPGAALAGASGIYCGDPSVTSISGGMVEFVRLFVSRVPPNRIEYSSGTLTYAPSYGQRRRIVRYSTTTGEPVSYKISNYVRYPSRTYVVPTKVTISYSTTVISSAFLTPQSFEVTQRDSSVSYSTTRDGQTITTEDEGAFDVTTTGGSGVVEGTSVRRWIGPIYEITNTKTA